MKILKVYIYKNIGETIELEIEVDNNITEDEAEEIAKDVFFNECSFGWELVDANNINR
ncbi:hypothetical protein [Megamonas rupellensis]|uniref:hypothetical protein n=1 Tax=Megamonas rupellensis TaxID=491921 RepID=UPI0015F31B24|nr:hypothetical protein [Megamonas rupellensis]